MVLCLTDASDSVLYILRDFRSGLSRHFDTDSTEPKAVVV